MGSKEPVSTHKKNPVRISILGFLAVLLCLSSCAEPGSHDTTLPFATDMMPSGSNATHDAAVRVDMMEFADADSAVQYVPQPPQLRRLTNQQYKNAIEDFFGLQLPPDMALGTDTQLHGFRNIATTVLSISETEVEGYEAASQWVAHQLSQNRSAHPIMPDCSPEERICIADTLQRVGSLLWRRPLTTNELNAILTAWSSLAEQPFTDDERLEIVLTALLQSPYFLYTVEHGVLLSPDSSERQRSTVELLTALTMLIWNVPPNAQQLSMYGHAIHDEARFDALLDDLLSDERARRGLLGFFEEYLQLDRLNNVDKSREHFPLMSNSLVSAFHTEAMGMINHVVLDTQEDIRNLLTTKHSFLNWELGQLYSEMVGVEFAMHRFSEQSPRQGFLTTGAFLSLNAHYSSTSPTYRGKYVQNRFFCFDVPPPPEGVDTTLEPVTPGEAITMRARVAQHNEDPVCNGCHQFMDPIGLAFENFDALGVWRTDEMGLPIDPSGELNGVRFRTHHELIDHLASQTDFAKCVTKQFVRYAWNRLELRSDRVVLEELDEVFAESGYRFEALVRAVVKHRAFRAVGEVTRE